MAMLGSSLSSMSKLWQAMVIGGSDGMHEMNSMKLAAEQIEY
jgi:hypothetical protein